MPPHASPPVRALRRLVAEDPEAPLAREVERALSAVRNLAAAIYSAARQPIVRLFEEVFDPSATPDEEAPEPQPTQGPEEFGVVLHRHRRVASVSLCLLLVVAAAVGAAPAVSLAGDPVPDAPAVESPAADAAPVVDAAGDVQAADGDVGDGSISNVMQPLDAVTGSGTGFQVYTVQGGDTLAKIGAKFGLTRNTIYWANSARVPNATTLRVGQKLVIPPANGMTVTVKANDTLSGYAAKYRSTTKAIMAANNMSSTSLAVGKLVFIPGVAPAIPPPPCGAACAGWNGQKLKWPVPSSHRITQYFTSTHWGLDIGASYGSPVVAAANGTVIWSGWKTGAGSGGGIVVWINHNGKIWTTYNHLSAVYVKKGQTVKAGQRIAAIGTTGMSTGPHLHFEVWTCFPWSRDGVSGTQNPLRYL